MTAAGSRAAVGTLSIIVLFLSLSKSVESFSTAVLPPTLTQARKSVYRNGPRSGNKEQQASLVAGRGLLHASNFFDDIQNFFNGGNNNENRNNENNKDNDDDEDDVYGGIPPIVSIPVKAIKPGGLRLFLMFYLMGMQNTPDRCSWKADQPSNGKEEHAIDFYFHDNTAMLSVKLKENEIKIYRIGTTPSTAYLMQETVIIQGILDELDQCAFDDNIPKEDRLLQLPEPENGIELARDVLSFG